MYQSFLIHSSADGHLGRFHVLATINSAAMNIGVHVSLSIFLKILKLSMQKLMCVCVCVCVCACVSVSIFHLHIGHVWNLSCRFGYRLQVPGDHCALSAQK